MTKEELKQEAEEYLKKDGTKAEQIFNMLNEISPLKITSKQVPFILAMIQQTFQDGAELGFQKGIKTRVNTTTISDFPIKDEWHYVKDGDLPAEDLRQRTHGYYLTASQHKSYKGFVFKVAYFTGDIFIAEGILNNVIAWKEIVPPELPKESE